MSPAPTHACPATTTGCCHPVHAAAAATVDSSLPHSGSLPRVLGPNPCIPISHGTCCLPSSCCPPVLTCHPPFLCCCPLCAATAALYVPPPSHSRCPHLPPFAATHPTHMPPAFRAPLPHTHMPLHSDGPPPPTCFPCAQTPPTACPRPTPTYGDAPQATLSSPQCVPSSMAPSARPGPSPTRLGAPPPVLASPLFWAPTHV